MYKYFLVVLIFIGFIFFSCENESPVTHSTITFDINGYIIDKETDQPIPGIEILLDSTQVISDSTGYFYINNIPPSNYLLSLRHPDYYPIDTVITLNKNVSFTFYLISNLLNFSGTILDSFSQIPVSNAVITFNNMSILSDSEGRFEFNDIREDNYVISIHHENYFTLDSSLTITHDTESTFLLLQKSDYWPIGIGTEWKYEFNARVQAYDPFSIEEYEGTLVWQVTNVTSTEFTIEYQIKVISTYSGYRLFQGQDPDTIHRENVEFSIFLSQEDGNFNIINTQSDNYFEKIFNIFKISFNKIPKIKRYFPANYEKVLYFESNVIPVRRYTQELGIGLTYLYCYDHIYYWKMPVLLEFNLVE